MVSPCIDDNSPVFSKLGFGGWGIGGRTKGQTSYGDTDDNTSLEALRKAIELGVTFFDTSNVYGDGHSECLIGTAVKNHRDAVTIATKAGWTSYNQPADYTPSSIEHSLLGSLNRLQTDYVDILQLHNPPVELISNSPGLFEEFLIGLKQRGLIRAIGISLANPYDGLVFVDHWPVDCIQVNLNLMDQRAVINGLIGVCEARDISIIARSPLCAGFLTERLNDMRQFPAGDHRKRWDKRQLDAWDRGRELFKAMSLGATDEPIQDIALRFCLGFSPVVTVLTGMLTPSEVMANARAIARGALAPQAQEKALEAGRTKRFFL